MLSEQGVEVNVAHAVAVGEHKCLRSDVFLYPLYPRTGLGVQAGVHEGHPPGLGYVGMNGYMVLRRKIKGNVRTVQIIVRKIFLNHMALVAAANDEVIKAKAGIILHYVPQNGLLSYGNHRFGLQVALFADAGAQTAR